MKENTISNIKIKNCSDLNQFYIITIKDVGAFLYISECVFQDTSMPIVEVSSLSQEGCLINTKSHLLTSNRLLKRVIDLFNTNNHIKESIFSMTDEKCFLSIMLFSIFENNT